MAVDDNRIDDDEFEARKETIEQDVENTLERVINDYANHWKGVLGESIQNSYDGWAENRFTRSVIPEDEDLVIHFIIDVNNREFVWVDNAGGMPSEIFYTKFAGLDTPGEEKQTGGAGGSYGRGFHVIAGLGEEAYAETKHGGFHGGLVVRGPYQARYDDLNDLRVQGTQVTVKDCKPEVLLKLADRERVHRHIQARFQRMLEHENVTVRVTIDGETTEVEPVNLSGFEVLWEGDIPFEHAGEEKVLKNAVIYKKDGADIPFEGMSMCKRNEHMNEPFMRVKEYRPRQIKHLDKMFGFCDASVLCPRYENNAHTGWVGGVLPAGIKSVFEQIEREQFIGGPTRIDQRDEIIQSALEMLVSQWEDNPFELSANADDLDFELGADEPAPDSMSGEGQLGGPEQAQIPMEELDGDPEEDDVYVDETETDVESETEIEETGDPEPVLRCRTKRRTFDAGETIDIRVLVDNPEGSGEEEWDVDGEIEDEDGNTLNLEPQTISVPEGDTSGGADGWEFEPSDEEGKFVFRAELHKPGLISKRAEGAVDATNTYFFVGDTIEEETGKPKRTFIENIKLFPDPDDHEFRHELQEGDEAFILVANPSHPEYRYAEKLDGRNAKKNQVATLVRWGQEAIMTYLLLDRLEAELQNREDDEGEPLDEKFTGFVRERIMDDLSSFTAQTYESLS